MCLLLASWQKFQPNHECLCESNHCQMIRFTFADYQSADFCSKQCLSHRDIQGDPWIHNLSILIILLKLLANTKHIILNILTAGVDASMRPTLQRTRYHSYHNRPITCPLPQFSTKGCLECRDVTRMQLISHFLFVIIHFLPDRAVKHHKSWSRLSSKEW